MVRNLNDRTTICVVRADRDWMIENIPANSDHERFHKLIDFWQRNYQVPNIVAWSRELNEELNPINRHIIEGIKKVLGENGRSN